MPQRPSEDRRSGREAVRGVVQDSVRGRRRSTRDRPAKAPLSEEVIVDTALRVLREEGLDAVTMRRVASELDTGAASLYVYISGRDELRSAMLDRIASLVPLPPPDPERWREQVHGLLANNLAALEAHPGIAQVAVANIPTTEHTLDGAENLLAVLLAGGIDAQDAAWACDVLSLIVTATAVETAAYQARGASEDMGETIAEVTRAFRAMPPARYPQLTAHVDEMTAGGGDERFAFAIDTFLDGLVARAASAAVP